MKENDLDYLVEMHIREPFSRVLIELLQVYTCSGSTWIFNANKPQMLLEKHAQGGLILGEAKYLPKTLS